MALTSRKPRKSHAPEKIDTKPTDQERLDAALSLARERLAGYKNKKIRRAAALLDEFDGHVIPVVVEADVEAGEAYYLLEKELIHEIFSPASRPTRIGMGVEIVPDLVAFVGPTSRVALLA